MSKQFSQFPFGTPVRDTDRILIGRPDPASASGFSNYLLTWAELKAAIGISSIVVGEPELPEDPVVIPGPRGADGSIGVNGRDGITVYVEPELPEDPLIIPGPTGPQGPAGGGGGSATTTEINLGSVATWRGKFTLTDAAISATSKVLCWQAPGPYTGKGTRADEAELAPVQVIAVTPAAGSAIVYWQTSPVYTTEQKVSNGGRLQPIGSTYDRAGNQRLPIVLVNKRINKVRGNIKFSYLVFS